MLQYDRFICRFDGVAVAEIQLAYPHRSPAIEERDRIAGIIFNAHLANIDRRDAVYTQSDGIDAGMMRMVGRSEENTSELQSLMRISYADFCLKKKKKYQK